MLGGLAIGLVPGMPELEAKPELIFFGVLPPLLYGAAFFTSLRDLRANMRPIGLLAVGLVVATTVGVAVVAHAVVDGLTWPAAFVLGAIVSPTDPLAATAIARRLGVPRKLVSIVEGESLVNDGTGLVLYRVAVAAVLTGSFSAAATGGSFVLSVVGGVAVGLAVGWIVRQVRRRLDNPPAEITISLMTGYFAFLPADLLGFSAVLAAVTAGIYLGWHTPELTTSQVRLQGIAVWEIVQYLLNALLFVLIGLQLPIVVDALGDIGRAALRLRRADQRDGDRRALRVGLRRPSRAEEDRPPDVELAGSGLPLLGGHARRGVSGGSARPAARDGRGAPFPGRDLILFLTFSVILATLVGQGLTLPLVIRALGLEEDESEAARTRRPASERPRPRSRASRSSRARTGYATIPPSGCGVSTASGPTVSPASTTATTEAIELRSQDFQRLRRELLEAERQSVLELRRSGVISNDVWLRVSAISTSKISASTPDGWKSVRRRDQAVGQPHVGAPRLQDGERAVEPGEDARHPVERAHAHSNSVPPSLRQLRESRW